MKVNNFHVSLTPSVVIEKDIFSICCHEKLPLVVKLNELEWEESVSGFIRISFDMMGNPKDIGARIVFNFSFIFFCLFFFFLWPSSIFSKDFSNRFLHSSHWFLTNPNISVWFERSVWDWRFSKNKTKREDNNLSKKKKKTGKLWAFVFSLTSVCLLKFGCSFVCNSTRSYPSPVRRAFGYCLQKDVNFSSQYPSILSEIQ